MKNVIQNEINKKAVIYCRVSTKEQVEDGNSLVSQERLCREYATKQGYDVIEIFIEKGESAKTAERTELKKMMSFCTSKKGFVQVVIAYKIDRISRNLADYSQIRILLKRYGVEIKSATEYFEDTPAGRFMENIIANVSEFDNDVRTERCIAGMREATQEGRYVWMAPLGYDNVKVNGKSTIAQNIMAPLVRETFELIVQTGTPEPVRYLMIKKGLVGRKGQIMPRSNFYRLIRNPLYKGEIKKFGLIIKGAFDAIVSEELFDDVQGILRGRNKKMKHYLHENPDFPLRRFVVNENGKQLTGYWSKGKRLKYPYYSFHQRNSTIRKEILEQKFANFLAQYEFDDRYMSIIKKFLHKHFLYHASIEKNERESIEVRISEINNQIDKLVDIHQNGGINMTSLAERTTKLEKDIEYLKDLLKNRTTIQDIDIAELLEFAAEILPHPENIWLKSTPEKKRAVQVFDFPNGVVFDGENFRTPKVCSLFKIKSDFEHHDAQLVPSDSTGTNTACTPNQPPSDNFKETKDYWNIVVDDLLKLKGILDEKVD